MSVTLGEIETATSFGLRRASQEQVAVTVSDVTHDSRSVVAGTIFCALRGATVDGHDFATQAVASGASALLVEEELEVDVPQFVVADARKSMGHLASVVHGHASESMTVVGVTGTNGKSSVVQLLSDIWDKRGLQNDTYGTLSGARTTPESSDLQRMLRSSADNGRSAVAMEVSSHGIELGRVLGTSFSCCIFTNLGHDHLDFHGTVENYFSAKAALFSPEYTATAVINIDDVYGRRIAEQSTTEILRYGLKDAVDLTFNGPTSSFVWRGQTVELHLAGVHNVYNALAAAAAAEKLGVPADVIADALCATSPVRGRFEMVNAGQPFTVAVDYAHTPDALSAALDAARSIVTEASDDSRTSERRVILVFGCGGDRDQQKRPKMGEIAEASADLIIVTTDNPRSENPKDIEKDILSGFSNPTAATVEPDRASAIELAVTKAEPGDVVLIAGKGHETEQIVGADVSHFDDRQAVLQVLGAIS